MRKIILIFTFLTVVFNLFGAWSNDASFNTAISTLESEQVIPKIEHGPDGTFYVGFFVSFGGQYDVYLQHLDAEGNILWETTGLEISNHESMTWLTDWDMTVDNDNNAILAFQDIRNTNNDIFVYKISNSGEFLWGADGIELSQEGFNAAPKVTVLSDNNIVVAWMSDACASFQCLSPDGTLLTGDNEVTLEDPQGVISYSWPQAVAVEDGNFILKYYQDSGPSWSPTRHVYAQKFNSSGETLWDSPAVLSNAGGISSWTQVLSIVKDVNNGLYIAWHDDRDMDNDYEAFVQHVSSEGAVSFTNGLNLSNQNTYQHFEPKLAYDSENDALYINWVITDLNQNERGIHGQKLQNDELQWGNDGENILPLLTGSTSVLGLFFNDNELISVYERSINGNTSYLYSTKFDSEGNSLWNEDVLMKSSAGSIVHADIVMDDNNQIVSAWENVTEITRIMAQNINWNGQLGLITPESGIEGTVSLSNEAYNVEEVTITIGDDEYAPDADGNFSFTYAVGTYTLIFSHEYYESLEEEVTIIAGEYTSLTIELTNELVSGFAGNVTLSSSDYDPADVLITIEELTTSPDTNGDYSIEYMPGTYEVAFSHPNYETVTLSVTITLGEFTLVDVIMEDAVSNDTPEISTILEIYPNPLLISEAKSLGTTINFTNIEPGNVSLEIYNLKGQLVKTLANEYFTKGNHTLTWNGYNSQNQSVATGIYFLQLNSKNMNEMRKITVLK